MTIRHYLRNAKQHIAKKGPRRGLSAVAQETKQGVIRRAGKRVGIPGGRKVLEDDWDILLVLDACRVDAINEVAGDYPWLPEDVPTTRSTAGMSEEWLETQFVDDYHREKQRTGHVTWNAFAGHVLEDENWAFVDHLYESDWDDDLGLVKPGVAVDRGIQRWQSGACDRLIIHMMQPHRPYRQQIEGVTRPSSEEVGNRDTKNTTVWTLLRRGDVSRETVWNAYLDNLHWGLESVEDLLGAVDADVVLTSDHGECFGEYGLYGHVRGVPAPELVKVPWVTLEATSGDYQPDVADIESTPEADSTVDERLESLGYL